MSSKHDAKLVILGASGVGKTCLGLRFVKDQFVAYTASTIGASFLVKEVRALGCPLVVVGDSDVPLREPTRPNSLSRPCGR